MGLIIGWVILCLLVGLAGKEKNIGYWGTFFLSLLLSPLIGLIIAVASSPKKVAPKKIIRCDGCREVIEGEYLAIRPKGLKEKYDYCSEECRNEYHPKYMLEKGVNWVPPVKEIANE